MGKKTPRIRRSRSRQAPTTSRSAKTPAQNPSARDIEKPQEPSLARKLVFSLLAFAIFFGSIELLLATLGIEPVLYQDDPYVGFSSVVPHFVPGSAEDGAEAYETAANKLRLFNPQSFARHKAKGVTRVFCLGGSTTYGRPYGDVTSFCGWLRELLAAADPSRRFEVINAGGISYASYRVAALMEELLDHQPDLFIVYTGHNEFLEQRTYGRILAYPAAVRGLGAQASRTRLFTAAQGMLNRRQQVAQPESSQGPTLLDADVRTLLDASVGPDAYQRDDALRAQVLEHYRYSLTRMAEMARSAGTDLILVKPASNLRHSSPFKSQSLAGLDDESRVRWQTLYAEAEKAEEARRWQEALSALEKAIEIDPRHAGAHYLRGHALDQLGRHGEAKAAFVQARDEDVCPLRALGAMGDIVVDVARERDVPLVDFVTLVEESSPQGIPGENLFLDHVHPTIEGNRLLALELLDTLRREGHVTPGPEWGPAIVRKIALAVESQLDPEAHGRALSNLSKVLGWAGKLDEAYKLATRAGRMAPNLAEVNHQSALAAHLTGHLEEAERFYRRTLELAPATATAHSNLAVILDEAGRDREAASHYKQAIMLLSDKNAEYRAQLKKALAKLEAAAPN